MMSFYCRRTSDGHVNVHVLIQGTCACYFIWQSFPQMCLKLSISRWRGWGRMILDYEGEHYRTSHEPFKRKSGEDFKHKRRKQCDLGGREESDRARGQRNASSYQKLEEYRNRSFPRSSGGSVVLLAPWFWLSKTDFGFLGSRIIRI